MYPRKIIKHELKRKKKELYVLKKALGDVGTIKIRISRRQNLVVRYGGGGRGIENYHFLLLNSHIYGRIYII